MQEKQARRARRARAQIAGLALAVVWILAVTGVAMFGKNVAPSVGGGPIMVPAERQEEPAPPRPSPFPEPDPAAPPVIVEPTDVLELPCAPYCDPGK